MAEEHAERQSLPPHSPESERAVLGSMLLDQGACAAAMEKLRSEMFFIPANVAIFEVCEDLFENDQAVDTVTVFERLKWLKKDSVVDLTYLTSLPEQVPTTTNIEYYADRVHDCWRVRQMILACGKAYHSLKGLEQDTADNAIDAAERMVFEAAERQMKGEFQTLSQIAVTRAEELIAMAERGEGVTGIPTGYNQLDLLTGGLHVGEFAVIAARPSIGKTALAWNIAVNIARKGFGVAFFSLEMSKSQLFDRELIRTTGFDGRRLRLGKLTSNEWQRITSMSQTVRKWPMFVDDSSKMSPMEMRARIRRLKGDKPLSVVMIDYLQLMTIPGFRDNREQEVSSISRHMKAIAKDFKVAVVALCQLNRESEKSVKDGMPARPRLSQLRESGSIEQDADCVFMLHRPGFYKKKDPEEEKKAELIIEKQRSGPTAVINLIFEKELTVFKEAQ